MIIRSAKFVISNSDVRKCPRSSAPEFAFIGRSNVGKSSLVNMLVQNKNMAKTSGRPGKTQLINHFWINDEWFLVDLPGYGFAKVSKSLRENWEKFINDYLMFRENLTCLFVLIDCRLEPQKIDLEFLQTVGANRIPFAVIFTKADKVSKLQLETSAQRFKDAMLENFEFLPQFFYTSAETEQGREDVLNFIQETIAEFQKPIEGAL